MIRTNASDLVEAAIAGEVWPAAANRDPYKVDSEGTPAVTLGMGGICFTHRVGDPAFGWEGDHLEPGVSVRNSDPGAEHALHYMVCVGNEAVVTSGACLGARGVVSGEHAHVLVDFPAGSIDMLAIGDRIQIKSVGLGLRLLDYPDVVVHKMSPRLLDVMGIESTGEGTLMVPVVREIPARFMGSGGELNADYVDQDFMTGDREELHRLGLDSLRIGDIVAVPDHNHTWGRGYRTGATTIGLIIHGDSAWTGHGPGVLDLMSTTSGNLLPVIDSDANIALRLGIRSKQELDARRNSSRVSSFARRGLDATSTR